MAQPVTLSLHCWKFLLVGLLMLGCQRNLFRQAEPTAAPTLEDVARSVLGEGYQIVTNTTEDFALVYATKKLKPRDVFPSVEFFIYDLEKATITFKRSLPQGTVEWLSQDVVGYRYLSGTVERQRERYTYNVRTKQQDQTHE